jgi:5-methylcytosine-specific restriction endonuclease McrA|tara:strand:+ start:216 stop:947 length:732 start_codon:yes stop_codon:yes gene_type:complete
MPRADKECTKCGETKTLDRFAEFKWKNVAGEERISCRRICRACRQEQQTKSYARKAGSVSEYRHLEHKQKYAKKEYREKILARNRQWAKENREQVTRSQLEWQNKNRERVREVNRIWRAANPEKVKAASDRYQKANKQLLLERQHGYRMRREGIESDGHTISEMHDYWRSKGIDPKICAYCSKTWEKWKTSIGDHIVPLTRGGTDVLENMNPSCGSCNSSKNNRLLHAEWTPPNMRELETSAR